MTSSIDALAQVQGLWHDTRPRIVQVFDDIFAQTRGRDLIILIDGLGVDSLTNHAGYVRHLRPLLRDGETVHAPVPSTTASVLASYFTGTSPLEHGVLGYTVMDTHGRAINQLVGAPGIDPHDWGPRRTLGQREMGRSRALAHVGQARYAGSFLTRQLFDHWHFFPVTRGTQAAATIREALLSVGPGGLVYAHVASLDQAGHAHGPGSRPWLEALEDVDALIGQILTRCPPSTRITITSDHGMIAADHSRIIDLARASVAPMIHAVAGEGRALMVRFSERSDPGEAIQALRETVGDDGDVLSWDDIVTSGILGPRVSSLHHPLIEQRRGDALIFARERAQFTHSTWVSSQSLQQAGVHGSLSEAERLIPLWRTVSSRG